jgi:hypothetical protein
MAWMFDPAHRSEIEERYRAWSSKQSGQPNQIGGSILSVQRIGSLWPSSPMLSSTNLSNPESVSNADSTSVLLLAIPLYRFSDRSLGYHRTFGNRFLIDGSCILGWDFGRAIDGFEDLWRYKIFRAPPVFKSDNDPFLYESVDSRRRRLE